MGVGLTGEVNSKVRKQWKPCWRTEIMDENIQNSVNIEVCCIVHVLIQGLKEVLTNSEYGEEAYPFGAIIPI